MLNLYEGMSPLSFAARHARVDDVQRILQHEGGDANECDAQHRSALYWVCRSSMDRAQTILRIIDLLLDHKADPSLVDDEWCQGPLYWAAIRSPGLGSAGRTATFPSAAVIKRLLVAKANVDAQNSNGWTPLHAACARGSTSSVIELIQGGASIEIRSVPGTTRHGTVRVRTEEDSHALTPREVALEQQPKWEHPPLVLEYPRGWTAARQAGLPTTDQARLHAVVLAFHFQQAAGFPSDVLETCAAELWRRTWELAARGGWCAGVAPGAWPAQL